MEMTENTNIPVKWLRYLFYVKIGAVILSLFSGEWSTWLILAASAGEVWCLYKLVPLWQRYQKAALLEAIGLGLNLLSLITDGALVLTLAISILSLFATWQEYNAHSGLVAELDPILSEKWRKLFVWQLMAGILAAVMTAAATIALVLGEIGGAIIVAIITVLFTIIGLVASILYLVYLNKTAKLLGA